MEVVEAESAGDEGHGGHEQESYEHQSHEHQSQHESHGHESHEHENHEHESHEHESHHPHDSSITFEENDDGDNMVVVEEDLRENEHTGGHGHHESESGAEESALSEFDVSSDHETHHGHEGHGEHETHHHETHHESIGESSDGHSAMDSDSNAGSTNVDLDSIHGDIQTPLNKLLSESSDLAKEIRLVFQVLARREDYLVQEMELLKNALQNAIQVLHDSSKESNKLSRKRRELPNGKLNGVF